MHQMAFGVQMRNLQRINADHNIIRRQTGQFVVGEHAFHRQQPAFGRAQSTGVHHHVRQGRERPRHDAIE
jgi:hypothetical protein